jgi:hypothetical protein
MFIRTVRSVRNRSPSRPSASAFPPFPYRHEPSHLWSKICNTRILQSVVGFPLKWRRRMLSMATRPAGRHGPPRPAIWRNPCFIWATSPRPYPWLKRHTRSQPPNVAPIAFISRPVTPTKYAINQIFNPTFITIEQSSRFATWSSTNLTAFLGIVNHAVRLVNMEHHSNMSVVNTDTKGAGRDHLRLPTDLFLEETTTEREGGASDCLQSLSLQNNNSSTRSFIFRIQLFPAHAHYRVIGSIVCSRVRM